MYKLAKPFFMICETPTHVGSGSDLGIVDLPIQRERHTSFPKFESSSLKGALRERFEGIYSKNEERVSLQLAFGYDNAHENSAVKDYFEKKEEDAKNEIYQAQFSGALAFTDARLLFFPIKSLKGVFALTTSIQVLKKLSRELQMVQQLDERQNFSELISAIKQLENVELQSSHCACESIG